MLTRKFIASLVLIFGVALVAIGCADVLPKLKQTRDAAQVTLNATTQAVGELKTEVAALPPSDPGRAKLEDGIAKGEKVIAQAQDAVNKASAAIDSLEKGQLDPNLTGTLAGVPYGSYVALALTLGFGLYKNGKAGTAMDALTKVIHSWEAVGQPLSETEKAQVAAIQGTAVTTLVHDIKAELAG